jgi:large subunit ribosomal protein L21
MGCATNNHRSILQYSTTLQQHQQHVQPELQGTQTLHLQSLASLTLSSTNYTSHTSSLSLSTRYGNASNLRCNGSTLNNSDGTRLRWYSSTSAVQHDIEESSSSSSPPSPSFVVVDHSDAYDQSMRGRHGRQLALALLEGAGKDDPPFDPFVDEEVMLNNDYYDDDDQDEEEIVVEEKQNENIVEAEIVRSSELDSSSSKKNNNDDEKHYDSGYEEDDEEEDEDDDYYDDDDEMDLKYNPDGSIRRKKSTIATLRAGFPAGGLFAVLELAGSQHKVTTDDLMVVNKLKPVDEFSVGSIHTFKDNILLAGSSHLTLVGMPYVAGAEVDVMVEEITQDAKVIIFKKRRRKNSQRRNGFRRDLTLLRVLDVRLPSEYQHHHYVGRDSVDELDEAAAANSSRGGLSSSNSESSVSAA